MPDRKTIIKVLEQYKTYIFGDKDERVTVADILAMLKSNEPVEATVCNNDISGAGSWWYQCGKCKMPIDPKDRFCRHCGQEAKGE